MSHFLGCDLGIQGALTLIDDNGKIVFCEPMPIVEVEVKGKKRNQYDIEEIYKFIRDSDLDFKITAMAVERLTPIPTMAAQSNFGLGLGQGIFRMLSVARGIPYYEFSPKQWQKEMFKGLSFKDTKVASTTVAQRLAPGHNFKRTARCKKIDDGMTDSFLISLYLKKTI